MHACLSFILYTESITKNVVFPLLHLSDFYPFPSVSTLGPAFFTLSRDAASSLIFLLQTAPTDSPGAPRPPCKQLPAQLSEVLLLACSLIKNLQRPLTAYTTKSQPVCLSFRSLHYPPPLCPFHFISHSFPPWSLFYDRSPHWLRSFAFILLPCCVQAVPVPEIASFVPCDTQSYPLTKHLLCLHFDIEIRHALCRKFGQYRGI